MAEKSRELGNFKGLANLRLNFRLKSYVSRQCLWTVRRVNSYITTVPLEVFIHRNFVADTILLKLNFVFLKSLLSHPLGDLNVTYALYL